MNKKEFIKELETRLEVLDEQEIKDIVNEYKDIIDEKVKNGKTEEEAVSEFGSLDELTSEILKAYKINPKFSNNRDGFKDASKNFEGWIKETAQSLSDTAKGIYSNLKKSNNDISIELVFELIIKFIIMLVILAVLRLPFELINGLGDSIFDMAFFPADTVFSIIWRIFTSVLYFGVCVLVFIAMFKEYVNIDHDSIKNPESKKNKSQKKSENEIRHENVIKEESPKINKQRNKNSNINTILSIVYKFFMVMTFLIPLWFIQLGLVIGIGAAIYYTCIGINIWGLIIVLVGLSIGTGWVTSVFTQLTFKITKVHFYPAFISALIICIGCLSFAGNILSFDYINSAPEKTNYKSTNKTQEFTLTTLSPIISDEGNIDFKVDKKLEDNAIRVEMSYYTTFRNVTGISLETDDYGTYKLSYYDYQTTDYEDFNDFKVAYNLFIDNLKDGKLYNYEKLSDLNIKVFANEATLAKVRG